MNWDQIEGNWKQFKGTIREKWGKLSDDDLEQIAGKKDKLLGRLQESYGFSKERALKELEALDFEYKMDSADTRIEAQKGLQDKTEGRMGKGH